MSTRILVVEDDPPSLELALFLLDSAGYATSSASDGGTGLELALSTEPDMVLCDVQMPVLSGYSLVHQLHENSNWRRVPVVAISAFSMRGDRERALEAGFDGYLHKPIVPGTFVQEVESFLDPGQRLSPPARSAN
jgi:two-component system, cell cycle response regulator DivK